VGDLDPPTYWGVVCLAEERGGGAALPAVLTCFALSHFPNKNKRSLIGIVCGSGRSHSAGGTG
jgi:hypothetical protein